MAKKDRSFGAKVSKAKGGTVGRLCPRCGTVLETTFLVRPTRSDKGVYRFRQRFVHVCKCNRQALGL